MKIDKSIISATHTLSNVETGELFSTGDCYYIKTDFCPSSDSVACVNIETGGIVNFKINKEVYSTIYNLEVNIDE